MEKCRAGQAIGDKWRMHIACWIVQAANTRYVIVTSFPLQQWLKERASKLRYFYIAFVVFV